MSALDRPTQTPSFDNTEHDGDISGYGIEYGLDDPREETVLLNEDHTPPSPARAYFIRSLALLCACSLSIGSH